MAANDSMTVNPQGVQDPTAGTQFPGSKTVEISSPADAGKRDVVEGAPGVIESAELAPLGEGKVSSVNAATTASTGGSSYMEQAQDLAGQAQTVAGQVAGQAQEMAQQAYNAVMGEKK